MICIRKVGDIINASFLPNVKTNLTICRNTVDLSLLFCNVKVITVLIKPMGEKIVFSTLFQVLTGDCLAGWSAPDSSIVVYTLPHSSS